MTIPKPILDKATIVTNTWPLDSDYNSITLWPTGWLIGVLLENIIGQGYGSGEFEITDLTYRQFGKFYWEYSYNSAGIIFPKPLPNINTATPYLIRRCKRALSDPPIVTVKVHTIGCWF